MEELFPKKLSIFLITTFIPAYFLDLVIYLMGSANALTNPFYRSLLMVRMYFPMLGVIASSKCMGRGIKDDLKLYGLRLGRWILRLSLLSIALPYMIYLIGVGYAYTMGFPVQNPAIKFYELLPKDMRSILSPSTMFMVLVVSTIVQGVSMNTLLAIGEEIGWRGLMLEELMEKIGLPSSVIIIGVSWSFWHAPLIMLFGYNYPRDRLVGMIIFSILCVIWTYILSILKVLGGSILPPAVMHGMINAASALMIFTVPIDRILGMPVGILSAVSSATVLAPLIILKRIFIPSS